MVRSVALAFVFEAFGCALGRAGVTHVINQRGLTHFLRPAYPLPSEAFHGKHSGIFASFALAVAPRREYMAFIATSVRHGKPRPCLRGDACV